MGRTLQFTVMLLATERTPGTRDAALSARSRPRTPLAGEPLI